MTSVKVPEFLMLMAVKTIPILLCADRSGNNYLSYLFTERILLVILILISNLALRYST